MEKKRPLSCRRFPVSGAKPQPRSSSKGIRLTWSAWVCCRSSNHAWNASLLITPPSVASAEAASRDDSATVRREDTAEPGECKGSTVLSICITAPLHADVCTAPTAADLSSRSLHRGVLAFT